MKSDACKDIEQHGLNCTELYMFFFFHSIPVGFPVAQWWKIHLPMQKPQEVQVQSLGQEDPLEKGMAAHSSILDWKILRTEESSGLQSMGMQRVRHN